MHRRQFLDRIVAGTGGILLTGCSQSSPNADRSAEVEKRFGGKDSAKLLTNHDKVEAFRLVDSEGRETIDEYETVGDPVVVPAESAAKLGKLLSADDSYLWDVAVGCKPDYGVRIKFTRGDNALDVLFCFKCGMLATYVDGNRVSGAIFDPIHADLVKFMKSLFPKDEVIQKLKDAA
jgi:hypothetical protein